MSRSFLDLDPEVLAFVAFAWGMFVTVFWMVTAWRAMRAHEDFARVSEAQAKALERLAERR